MVLDIIWIIIVVFNAYIFHTYNLLFLQFLPFLKILCKNLIHVCVFGILFGSFDSHKSGKSHKLIEGDIFEILVWKADTLFIHKELIYF